MTKYTQPHPSYIIPDTNKVNIEMEACGYNRYFPVNIFYELLNLCSYQVLEDDFTLGYKPFNVGDQELYHKYKEFYDSIQFDFYCDINEGLISTVFRILKDLSEKVNLRKLNSYNKSFDQGEISNSKYEPSVIDIEVFKEEKEYDLSTILEFSTKIKGLIPINIGNNLTKVNTQIKKVKDIMKAKKSSFVKPTFIIDVLTKKLPIVDLISQDPNEEIMIYLEDATSSMLKNNGYVLSRSMQRLLLTDKRRVHYYRYAGDLIEFYDLKSLEDKVKIFSKNQKYYRSNCDYKYIFENIINKYNKGNLIIITDAEDDPPKNYSSNLSIYCVDASGRANFNMKRLCKSNNGKYIML